MPDEQLHDVGVRINPDAKTGEGLLRHKTCSGWELIRSDALSNKGRQEN